MNLGSSFNLIGIVNDGSTFSSTGGLDGGGAALSANLLGTSQTWNGTPFIIGAAGSSDVVSATGQTISLPAGQYASLQFLATAVSGNQANQTFTVKYSDGTTKTFTQSISDWFTPQNYAGESTAVPMSYRDNYDGTKDSRTFDVYGYSFSLDTTKTVSSITLPNDASVKLLSATLSGAASAPAAPSNLAATAGNNQVALSWAASSGATSYNVYRGTASGNETLLPAGKGVSGTSYTDTAVTNGTKYFYEVTAVNSVGESGKSNEVSATPAVNSVPAAPSNLAATAGNGQVALSWAASSGATSYNVYRGTASGKETLLPAGKGVSGTSYTDTAVTNGTKYYYEVTAVNSVGESGKSNEVSATPTATAGTTPVNLGSSFNLAGIVSDGSTFSGIGGLDGDGAALSANLLGTSVSAGGNTFTIGAAGSNNVVTAAGQTIVLPSGNYASLKFLATAINGNQANQTFTVTYTDGTTKTFTQSISDWFTPQNYAGESKAVTMSYRDLYNGTKDSRTFYVYLYSFALDSTKTIKSITLPNQGNVKILAIDLVS